MQPERAAGRLMRMKNELRVVLALALAGCALAGCGMTPPQPRPVMAHGVALREPLVSPRPYGAADTAFGLDALGAWCRADPQANLVLSPSSLASGLGMAYLGARGATARAMDGVLHLPSASGQALEAGLQARSTALRGLDGPGPFTTATGRQVSAQFMNGGPYASASARGWTAVWLPYGDGRLAMMALLPPAGRDFAGLSPQACCIGVVEHAATLQVGEKGTVASAATAVGIAASAAQAGPPPVVFDRPYLMVVTDRMTGEPLFMARVTDPTQP